MVGHVALEERGVLHDPLVLESLAEGLQVLALGDHELDRPAKLTRGVGLTDVPPAVDATGDDQQVGKGEGPVADPPRRTRLGADRLDFADAQ